MLGLQQYLPTPNGIQANGTGSLNLPSGATYYSLKMEITDGSTVMDISQMAKRIHNLRLKVNGIQVRQYATIRELININKAHGIETLEGKEGAPMGAVVFYFAEPQRRTPLGEDVFAWQMYQKLGVQSFNLEFDCTGECQNLNVQVSRDYAQLPEANLPANLPNMIFHSSQQLPNDNAGKPTTSTLQKVAYTRIHAYVKDEYVWAEGKTGILDGAQVKVNNLIIREFRNLDEYKSYMFENILPLVEDGAWVTIPFDETNRYDEILDVRSANSFEVQYNTKDAGAITLITEELKSLS